MILLRSHPPRKNAWRLLLAILLAACLIGTLLWSPKEMRAGESLAVQAWQNLSLDPAGRIVELAFDRDVDLIAPWDRFRFDLDIVQPLAHDSGAFLGDLSGDGVLDLLLADWDGHRLFFPGLPASPTLFGDGRLLRETTADPAQDPFAGPAGDWPGGDAGDVDGDGQNEIVIGKSIFKNTGAPAEPRLEHRFTLQFPGVFDPAAALGDLDGDGDLDAIASSNYASGGTFFCWNESTPGAISFQDCTAFSTDPYPKATGDLNGDGLLDLADYTGFYPNQGTKSAPAFPPTATPWQVSGGPAWNGQGDMWMAIALKDNTGDGLLDAYLSRVGDTAWQVLFYENTGSASAPHFTYRGPVTVTSAPLNMANRLYVDSGTMGLPRDAHLALGDIDANGHPEILLSPVWNDTSEISSNSSILWAFPPLEGGGGRDVYAYQDLYTYPFMARIDRYFGCGVGAWAPKDFLCAPPTIFGAWTDLDGDGLADAMRIAPGADQALLYQRIRAGSWPFTISADTPFSPGGAQATGMAIAVVDVNLDDQPDLVAGQEDGTLLYYQKTAGGYAAAQPLADASNNPIDAGDQASPTAIDLDGDADLDLLVADASGRIHIVENVSPGSRQGYALGGLLGAAEQDPIDIVHVIGGGWLSPTLATIDMDRDGLADVLMGDHSGQVWLLHNTGAPAAPAFSLDALNVSRTAAAYLEKIDARRVRLHFALPTTSGQTALEYHELPVAGGPSASGRVVIGDAPPAPADTATPTPTLTPTREAAPGEKIFLPQLSHHP